MLISIDGSNYFNPTKVAFLEAVQEDDSPLYYVNICFNNKSITISYGDKEGEEEYMLKVAKIINMVCGRLENCNYSTASPEPNEIQRINEQLLRFTERLDSKIDNQTTGY